MRAQPIRRVLRRFAIEHPRNVFAYRAGHAILRLVRKSRDVGCENDVWQRLQFTFAGRLGRANIKRCASDFARLESVDEIRFVDDLSA